MAQDVLLALPEQLLLAQAVHQSAKHPPDWNYVAGLIISHGTRTGPLADPNECEKTWQSLMLEYNIVDCAEAPSLHRSEAQLALAQLIYATYLANLQSALEQKAHRLQALRNDMDDLTSGKRDATLRAEHHVSIEEPLGESSQHEQTRGTLRKRLREDTDAASDEEDDEDEHLQVEQDLLGEDLAPIARDEEHEHASAEGSGSVTPSAPTTYGSRARRRSAAIDARTRVSEPEEERSRSSSPAQWQLHRSRNASLEEHTDTPAVEDTLVSEAERDKSRRRITHILLMLHNQVSNHTHGNLFHQAIKEVDAPDYYTLIKQPMDLKLIKQKIKEGSIGSTLELRRALSLMYANSLMYNKPGTEVHRMANEMRIATDELFDQFEQPP
ncbi:hypothetical protein MVES1_001234 [Malassezia vespertilionis]|uniref:Bromo domain-containing protein n=1 Tax=Malassezia vespertilionis TaxID=2020962 RepID=A0A2N1JFE2_9BASI|nr:uncharacterized protein MVES1_001234 [Malassezia vespertilionis]PKI85268.1 hypothetical protein MVES_001164 [Malassezia vespertilionis]WFD05900.1 hypothetical protein MVES1_001234 [Malassezia vespertilionis]